MPTFRFNNEIIPVRPGARWAAPVVGEVYHDTATGTLRAIVAEMQNGRPWREVVTEHFAKNQPWLYQIVTSPARDLFFREHPPRSGSKILDIGAGWGQIALPLARQGHRVTALEPTPERLAFIHAAAAQEQLLERMSFIQAGFHQIEFMSRFDLICCIGVLEWIPKFRPGHPQLVQIEFLKAIRTALATGGQLVIGIENRLGLKYVLGAPDDHICAPGIAVYDAELASRKWREQTGQELRSFTYTRAELSRMLSESGFTRLDFYAALPDYKLPQHIIPLDPPTLLDAFFLHREPVMEHNGANGQPLSNQDELTSHYRSLAELGVSQAFAPSYFVIAS